MSRVQRLGRLALIGVVVLGALPLVLMIVGAIDRPGLVPDPGLPDLVSPSLESFRLLDTFSPGLWSAVGTTLAVEAVAVPLTVLTASGAGFVLVAGGTVTRRVVLAVLAVTFFVPPVLLVVPRFVLLGELGVADGYLPLLLPALAGTSPVLVALFALAFARLPAGVFDAARVAGASPVRIWSRVAMPLVRPTVFAVAVLAFAYHWANLLDAVLYLGDRRPGTVSLALERLATLEATYHPVLMAGALVATVPPLVVLLVGHRAFLVKSVEP